MSDDDFAVNDDSAAQQAQGADQLDSPACQEKKDIGSSGYVDLRDHLQLYGTYLPLGIGSTCNLLGVFWNN